MNYLTALLMVVACWTAVMVWIGPPHHLQPWVHSLHGLYAVWGQVAQSVQVMA